MILQRLAEHYDRIVASGNEDSQLAPPGFSRQKISFCVVLEPDGRLNEFKSMQERVGRALVATSMIVPGQNKPTGIGINPCFLWDNASYMLGWNSDKKKAPRAIQSFDAFRKKHLELENRIAHPSFTAVCSFLRMWSPEMAKQYQEFLEGAEPGFGVFRVAGEINYVHEVVSVGLVDYENPSEEPEESFGGVIGMCLVSGVTGTIARLHEPKITGVANSPTYGALLVSCKDPAYRSYGKTQGYNAPVSSEVAFKYATALNYLLSKRNRPITLGDCTVVFWTDHSNKVLEDAINVIFSRTLPNEGLVIEEDKNRLREAVLLLKKLRDGVGATQVTPDDLPTKFFLLGLSPNASRISIRLWVEADAAQLQDLLGKHLRDIALDGDRDERLLTLRRIIAATGRWDARRYKFDTEIVSPQLTGDLSRSVLTGAAYPQSLLATMIRRIHSDSEVAYARVAAIKACLLRNSRLRGNPLEVKVKLDPADTNAAYNCGRLFALLEKVQTDSADGKLNTTIKDRYFSSASTTPALVFPLLFRLSQHHLAKLDTGQKIYYDRRLGEITGLIYEFPRQLALEDQGKFVIGYFHQRQDLYTSKKDKEEGVNA